jgi:hypothetical protein
MRILNRFLPLAMFFFFLIGSRTVAQVHPKVPPSHEKFLSGAALAPDLVPPFEEVRPLKD